MPIPILFGHHNLFTISSLANTVSTLEGMIHDQRVQMEKLVAECRGLTYKLDETTLKHK